MEEKDSDYFFGRERETVDILSALAGAPDRLAVLIGNSGVGKSSLAQAGVLAALKRQAWPEAARAPGGWPAAFRDSRQWCFLSLKPGTDPLKALVETFLDTWQFAATDFERIRQQNGLIGLLREGKANLPDLIDATERRRSELDQPKPPGFLLYIDQGEELNVRAEGAQRRRFSELIAQALPDRRLRIMMSMRSDFLGHLQNNEPLFRARELIEVPPLREDALRDIVGRPAELLSARFENESLIDIISRRTAEDSVKDVGALPLLSYTLDDMWTQMVRRGDGTLRLPAQSFELGGVLVDRANKFLETRPSAENALRRVLTLRLATVRDNGEPTRRRAAQSEFSETEWRLVSELADYPNRLLVTATPEGGETYAEVAHEAIFRRWDKLKAWVAAEREFLAWRSNLEGARRTWQATPGASKKDALLMGLSLAQAQAWIIKRAEDVPKVDREFIDRSVKREVLEREQRERRRRGTQILTAAAAVLFAVLAGIAFFAQKEANDQAERAIRAQKDADSAARQALDAQQETEDRQINLLAELATSESLRGNLDTALKLAVHAARLSAASAKDKAKITAPGPALAAGVWRSDWLLVLVGHDKAVYSAAFSPDGSRIVTASADKTARIWDAATGKEIAVLRGHEDNVLSVAFNPDGCALSRRQKTILAASGTR
jgi:hypothetical protein